MGKVAFVFPGQGSQVVGMGRAAHLACEQSRDTYAAADAALSESLSTLCFEGPEDVLRLTVNTQPALLATSIALVRAFGETPDAVLGHSLGEYSANVVAATLPFEHAVRLVRIRGTYMQEAVPVGRGAMAAVLGGELSAIEQALSAATGVVEAVNYNSPGQLVIAGEATAIEAIRPILVALGCKVLALPVSAPFHSSLMRPAEERLSRHLHDTPFSAPSVPVYVNVDAAPVRTGDGARDALVRQVSRPVRFQESVLRMRDDGVTLCVEIGPGKVLAGLIKRIDKTLKCVHVQTPDDFEPARAAMREARDQ